MQITLRQLKKLIKDVVNEMSPIGFGSLPYEDPNRSDDSFVEDFEVKNAVFNHLKALGGIIDLEEEPYGDVWNELEVWEIPMNIDPNSREYKGSVIVNGKRYYGEW